MHEALRGKRAVSGVRVSSIKQGTAGDSPEAQKEQVESFTQNHGITLVKEFRFMESAFHTKQPMQEAVDYFKDPKNKVDLFIIKSIDRFTRGGLDTYRPLKLQLRKHGVELMDIHGVINPNKVNTLDHLGVEYDWSGYYPSDKMEILEAERAKDEMRDIMTRMIGAEVRYTRLGYWMRQPPHGLRSKKIDTENGRRCILVPDEYEAQYITKIFELRARGTLSDKQIVDKINKMGYRSRQTNIRSKTDKTKITGKRGGVELSVKALQRIIERPIYAGVICEKWTDNQPVKAAFDGLISVKLFNKANKGKLTIVPDEENIQLYREDRPEHLTRKRVENPDFPYKQSVMCPECSKPLMGSASRGKAGTYYPAYHCGRGHYFRVPLERFNTAIAQFVDDIRVTPEYIDKIENAVIKEWEKHEAEEQNEELAFAARAQEIQSQIDLIGEKVMLISNEGLLKKMEDNVNKLEKELAELAKEKHQAKSKKNIDMRVVMKYIRYFLEHLDDLLIHHSNDLQKARFFSVIFDKAPNFAQIESGTQNPSLRPLLNKVFTMDFDTIGHLEGHLGLEPRTLGLRGRCSNQLS